MHETGRGLARASDEVNARAFGYERVLDTRTTVVVGVAVLELVAGERAPDAAADQRHRKDGAENDGYIPVRLGRIPEHGVESNAADGEHRVDEQRAHDATGDVPPLVFVQRGGASHAEHIVPPDVW